MTTVVKQEIAEIITRRIANGESNPIRDVPYSLEHVSNTEYRATVLAILKEKYGYEGE